MAKELSMVGKSKAVYKLGRMVNMEKRNQVFSIEDLMEQMDRKKLCFDYPIQREANQWDRQQKALLIDTVLNGYFIPDIYIMKEGTEEFSPMSVLDGKQRLTTLYEFSKDGFALPQDMDDVVITDVSFDEDKKPIKEEKLFSVCGKKFSDLAPEVQRIFNRFRVSVSLLAGFSDEQIEDQFYRLNNGCTFTKSQKANVLLGTELAGKIKELEQNDFFGNRAVIGNLQRKRGDVTSCILQSMMLISDFDYKSFSPNEVLRFAEQLNENPDYDLINKTKELFDELLCVLPPYDKELDKNCLKKIHIPILIKNLDTVHKMDEKVTDNQYEAFLLDWFTAGMVCSNYMDFCGHGSTSRVKVEGRISAMEEALYEFLEKRSI